MKLSNLTLKNYKSFKNANITFSKNLTCIVGVNGSGKSTILESIARCLKVAIFGISETIEKNEIRNLKENENKTSTEISLNLNLSNKESKITISNEIGKIYLNDFISKEDSKTVVAYYSVKRSEFEIDISAENEKDLFSKNSAYENSLNSITNYKDFFRWFRNREDKENSEMVRQFRMKNVDVNYEDSQLKAVRKAIFSLLPEFSNLSVNHDSLELMISKDETNLNFASLSDGEKGIIALFGDISRRLTLANPESSDSNQENGIILIDEIDQHLHPAWQRKIVPCLLKTFPKCQFVITTHSPQVLGEIKSENIRILSNGEIFTTNQSFGLSTQDILLNIMSDGKTDLTINSEIKNKLKKVSDLIDEEKFDTALSEIKKIEEETNGSTNATLELMSLATTLKGLQDD